jgi:hypothetical protein
MLICRSYILVFITLLCLYKKAVSTINYIQNSFIEYNVGTQ